MSYIGSLTRGSKWYNLNRDAEGNLTEVITNDLNKMIDINLYLKLIEGRNKKEVDTNILLLQEVGHVGGGKKTKKYAELKQKLLDLQNPVETKSKGKK